MNTMVNNKFTLDELIKKDKKSKTSKQKPQGKGQLKTGKGMGAQKRVQTRKPNQAVNPRLKNRGNAIYKKKVGINTGNAPQAQKVAARRQQRPVMAGRGRAALRGSRGALAVGQRSRQMARQNRRDGANNQVINKQIKKVPQQQQQQKSQPIQPKAQPTRLKVRNVDEKTVTEKDIHRLFSQQGQVIKAKFDKNQFGQYLGSATIVYDRLQSAQAAIKAYNGAQLDDRVMTVEFDIPTQFKKQINVVAPLTNQSIMQIPKVKKTSNAITKSGKTMNPRLNKQKQRPRSGVSAGKTLNVRGRKTDRK